MRFRDRMVSFMITRNGMDGLNLFLSVLVLLFMAVNSILRIFGAVYAFLILSFLEFLAVLPLGSITLSPK